MPREPRTATAAEMKVLKLAGFMPGEPGWWLVPDSEPITTDEALAFVKMVKDAYPKDRRAGKAGVRTTEFWMNLGVVLTFGIPGVAAMTGVIGTLPPPWGVVAGGVLTGISAGLTALYLRTRSELKRRGVEE